MSGFNLHTDRHALHGTTVVMETSGPVTYVGRFDRQEDGGVHLINVSVHDPAASQESKEEFLARTIKFGIAVDRKHLVVPESEVGRIVPLGDWSE